MKKPILCFAFLYLGACGFAQTSITASGKPQQLTAAKSPEAAGISSERLKRIDRALNDLVAQDKIPGAVALFARNGQIFYQKAFGYADFQTKRAMKTDDIFRIASMTKAVTATAVMMLYEEGKFGLDDPISKYIPEFKNQVVFKSFRFADSTFVSEPAKSQITIRQLLTHTSGIGYGAIDNEENFRAIFKKAGIIDAWTTEPVKIGDNIKKLAKLPLHSQPGEKWIYSEGFDVLGYFIEQMSGIPFDEYLKTHIFEPMGMNDTYFYLPDSKKDRLIPVQRPDSLQKWAPVPVIYDYPIKGAKTFFSGGGGLSSTAKDYAMFLQMLLNDGVYNNKRFLSRPTAQLMTQSDQCGDLFGGAAGTAYFSLGFSVVNQRGHDKGNGSVGAFSWGGYFNTGYWVDPKEKILMVLMKQTINAQGDDSSAVASRLIYDSIDD